MEIPIFELKYLKSSDILSSNTSEMKEMVIFAMLFAPNVIRDVMKTLIIGVHGLLAQKTMHPNN